MKYIFDMDGTLIDSMPIFASSMITVLEQNNIEYPKDIMKTITPLGLSGIAEYFIGLGINMNKNELLAVMTDNLKYEYENNIPAKPYVEEKLRQLKNSGHSLNVLTASPHETLDPCLKRLGIYELFDNVWSSDDFEYKKSNPEIYSAAAKRLNADVSECIFLDDNINAVTAAKKAGMKTIGVYDKCGDAFWDKMRKECDRYIVSFDEI